MTELNVHQRINKVMEDVGYIEKEDKKVNGQYTFVSHDAVTGKCRKAFVKHGINVIPTIVSREQNGNRTEMTISVDFVNIDKPEDRVTTTSHGYGIDNQDKGVGKAYSYAYKYALLKVLALETGDDPERDSIDHKQEKKRKKSSEAHNEAWGLWFEQYKQQLMGIANMDDLKLSWESEQSSLNKLGKAYPEKFKELEKIKDNLKDQFEALVH